ncbi:MAG: lytic transglycosylase domain-containing protein [Burkholderiaceae bacterium]|nr:MAG: lytic transglycosylase domain-containing protein [Burkholderiaceae bacterium]TAM09242.1 MAG: lytic transglycosylase domain-containing protein [Pusillimonas sp.]
MADRSLENTLSRSVRIAQSQLGEVVHVAAVYLGIAALVMMVLGVSVPSLREQSRQMHEALLVSLRPPTLQDDNTLDSYGSDLAALPVETPSPSSATLGPPSPTTSSAAVSTAQKGGSAAAPATSAAPAPSARVAIEAVKAAPSDRHGAAPSLIRGTTALSIPGVTRTQAQALRSYIARKYKIAVSVAGVLVQTAFSVGKEFGLDPQLLLAVIAIESRYNPYAESHVGALGLMQVMTDVHKDKFARYGNPADAAINPIANIRVGSQILADCIKRRGSVQGGLACYVGASGADDDGYGSKVLAERRRIALASGIPLR